MEKYSGFCQCGAIQFEARADLKSSITCNCSRCKPMALILAFTSEENFELKQGTENLTEYRFNKKEIQHLFCRTCGVQCFAIGKAPDGGKVFAINANCLDGVDTTELDCERIDGRSF